MKKRITFVDTCVLIAAFKGKEEISVKALSVLDDPSREYVSSVFVKLEALPKPVYFKRDLEVKFFQTFFDNVDHWAGDLEDVVNLASEKASLYGLAAMDSLHLAAAMSVGADEFVTSEKPSKPIHRVKDIKIVRI
jgi:predicted nucleic acid-binding protein